LAQAAVEGTTSGGPEAYERRGLSGLKVERDRYFTADKPLSAYWITAETLPERPELAA
jgi:hypothetical protein